MSLLSEKAVEKSTYVVTASFTDAAGAAVVPDSIAWTLSDMAGNVINSRSAVAIAVPAASVDIVLSNLDLALTAGVSNRRKLLVAAVYDSDEGDNLPLKQECEFDIIPLTNVS